jgi:hypothetical protein
VHQDRTKSRGLDQPSDFRRHYTIAIKIFPALHQKSFRSCDMRHRLAVRSRVVMPPRGIKSCPAFPHNLEPRFAQRGSFFLGSVTTWDRFLRCGRLFCAFPNQLSLPTARCSRVGVLHFVARDRYGSLLIGPVPIRKRAAFDVKDKCMIRLIDGVGAKVRNGALYHRLIFIRSPEISWTGS